MKKDRLNLPTALLLPNLGQLEWLPKNPRQWTQDDIDRTAKSIAEDYDFLEDRPLLAVPNGNTFVVFAGNLRMTAARQSKVDSVPVIVYTAENEDDQQTILRRAMKDNGSFGAWDWDALANEWDDLPLGDWGVPAWPSAEDEGESSSEKHTQEDDFDEETDRIEVRCKRGDIWQLGKHRLMCGDSTDSVCWETLMQGERARLCVTSPPYGVGMEYEEKGIEPWRKTIFGVIDNITKHALVICWNIGDLFGTGTQFIEPTSMYSTERMKENKFGLMYSRIWKKQGANFNGVNPYHLVSMKPVQEYEWILGYADLEYEKYYAPIIQKMKKWADAASLDNSILKEITGAGFMYGHWFTPHQWAMIDAENYAKIQRYCHENGIDAFDEDYDTLRDHYNRLNIYQKTLTDDERSEWGQWAIWEISTVSRREGHPAAFPVELPARLIKMHSYPNDIVIEPFGGSGTTMIAAEQLGRKCYMMEIDPHYCDVIIARWEKATGRTAEKLN